MKNARWTMVSAYVLGAAAFFGGTGLMVSSGWLITMAATHPPVLTPSVAIVLVRFFGISRSVSRYFERLISHKAVFIRLTELRVQLFHKLSQKSVAFARDLNSGAMVKKIVDDVERAQEYQLRITLPHISAWIALLSGALVGWVLRPQSAYITIATSIILLYPLPQAIKKVCEKSAREIETLESKYASLLSRLTFGITEAKIYGYLENMQSETHVFEADIKGRELKLITKIKHLQTIGSLITASSLVALATLAYLNKSEKNIPNVQVTMLIFLPLVMYEAVAAWYPNLFNAGKLLTAQDAIQDVMNQETPQMRVKKNFSNSATSITLDSVRVSWGQEFMSPISFNLQLGESIVMRGRSGSGKSTLAMGLIGALEYSGSIRINDVELGEIENLHEVLVGTVQQSHIFNTSIRENLKIGLQEATDDELRAVMKVVELDDLISEERGGLDAVIGSYGRAISGGESKRINLARALLSKAPILVLDEPTEHLNEELAARVESKVMHMCRSKILIVITHSGWQDVSRTLEIKR